MPCTSICRPGSGGFRAAEGVSDTVLFHPATCCCRQTAARLACLEVAVLIEALIVRQVYLVIDTSELPVMNHRSGVVDVFFGIAEAYYNGSRLQWSLQVRLLSPPLPILQPFRGLRRCNASLWQRPQR